MFQGEPIMKTDMTIRSIRLLPLLLPVAFGVYWGADQIGLGQTGSALVAAIGTGWLFGRLTRRPEDA